MLQVRQHWPFLSNLVLIYGLSFVSSFMVLLFDVIVRSEVVAHAHEWYNPLYEHLHVCCSTYLIHPGYNIAKDIAKGVVIQPLKTHLNWLPYRKSSLMLQVRQHWPFLSNLVLIYGLSFVSSFMVLLFDVIVRSEVVAHAHEWYNPLYEHLHVCCSTYLIHPGYNIAKDIAKGVVIQPLKIHLNWKGTQ